MKVALRPVTTRWKDIGLALRLNPDKLDEIEKDNRDSSNCLTRALTLWLKRNYNTERFGDPSWEVLARAVAHDDGGNDPALAEKIKGNSLKCWGGGGGGGGDLSCSLLMHSHMQRRRIVVVKILLFTLSCPSVYHHFPQPTFSRHKLCKIMSIFFRAFLQATRKLLSWMYVVRRCVENGSFRTTLIFMHIVKRNYDTDDIHHPTFATYMQSHDNAQKTGQICCS